jgi:hypothetical protein
MTLLDIFTNFDSYETVYFMGIIAVLLVISLIPAIFYLLTLQDTLRSIHYLNRAIEPGKVWLMLIPLFNLVWMFMVVSRVASSIKNELIARGELIAERPTYNIGIAWCVLFLVGRIPFIGGLSSLAFLVCWIIHWVKVNEYKKRFLADPYEPGQESQIFDYV